MKHALPPVVVAIIPRALQQAAAGIVVRASGRCRGNALAYAAQLFRGLLGLVILDAVLVRCGGHTVRGARGRFRRRPVLVAVAGEIADGAFVAEQLEKLELGREVPVRLTVDVEIGAILRRPVFLDAARRIAVLLRAARLQRECICPSIRLIPDVGVGSGTSVWTRRTTTPRPISKRSERPWSASAHLDQAKSSRPGSGMRACSPGSTRFEDAILVVASRGETAPGSDCIDVLTRSGLRRLQT